MRRLPFLLLSGLVAASAACAESNGILVRAGTAGSVTVSVQADSVPVANVRVDMTGPEVRTGTTGGNGTVTFGSLDSGTYVATISGYPANVSFPATSDTLVVVDSGPAQTITFSGANLGN